MSDDGAFGPFSKLVEIRLLDRAVRVPEGNVLLRCFQYLAPELPYGPWCWNGDCGSDEITYRHPGDREARTGLSCQIPVREGMEISEISADLSRFLVPFLSTDDKGVAEEEPVPTS
jgi:hypothetical protein